MNKVAEAQQSWLILETVWPIVFALMVSQVYSELWLCQLCLSSSFWEVSRHCSIINDPGSRRYLAFLHTVNTLIQPFIVSVRRKQIYFKLTVWEMSTFFCLMFLTVFFHINHFIFPLVMGLILFSFLVVSCLVCQAVFHHDIVTQHSSSWQRVCHKCVPLLVMFTHIQKPQCCWIEL